MTLSDSEKIELLERKVAYLSALRTSASRIGDIPRLTELDVEIDETKAELATLRAKST